MKNKWLKVYFIVLIVGFALYLIGCDKEKSSDDFVESSAELISDNTEKESEKSTADTQAGNSEDNQSAGSDIIPPNPTPGIFIFRDVHGKEYETVIQPDVPACEYDKELFVHHKKRVTYKDDSYETVCGIDVSYHQGNIDWQKVRSQGFEFAFIRIGYRGYGQKGSLNKDEMFETYIKGAQEAGIQVGVYFFAQAIDENEAVEEADYVLKILDGRKLDLPVVYDPETITDDTARTDNVSGLQFTENTRAFCDKIKNAGYDPMIYANMIWEAYELDLTELTDIPIWYADYEEKPQTPYHFLCWQYSQNGKVKGINGQVDLDVIIRKKIK